MKPNTHIYEGSHAIALTIKNIAPAVVSAYPITPQTHIVEDLAKLKADGQANFEYVRAESEFAAASIILGASATGVRVYSATSSQGLLLMTEVLYNIAGLRLPIVMTCANRAVSAPINIWNDHSDVMSIRDAGWIQFFASDNQEAIEQHILAYKIAERLNLPVMVNVDGYILTHAYEPVSIPSPELIKKYLPAYQPADDTYLNPESPVTFGAFFTPANYLETRSDLQNDLLTSLDEIKKEYKLLKKIIGGGGEDNGLVEYYGPKNPETILVAMGSMIGTMRETIKKYPRVGILKIKVFRPFPEETIIKNFRGAKNIAVMEKAISLGHYGPLFTDLKTALDKNNFNLKNYIVGLGGRDVTGKIISQIIKDASHKNKTLKFFGEI